MSYQLKEKTNLSYVGGGSDKVYIVELHEETTTGLCVVNCNYGRRHSTLNSASKTPAPITYLAAKKIFDKVVKDKTAKGYQVVSTTSGTNAAQAAPTQQQPLAQSTAFGLLPMLLNPVDEEELEDLLANDTWGIQEKMDGERRMVAKRDGEWIGANKKGGIVPLPAALVDCLSKAYLPEDVILDGEIIGDIYYVFDVLHWDGKSLLDSTLRIRREYLDKVNYGDSPIRKVPAIDLVRVVPWHLGEAAKRAFFERAKAENLEGVVLKSAGSIYTAGRPNSGGDHLKYKFVESATVVVSKVNNGKRSVAFGAFDGESVFHNLGNVTIPPNHEIPEKGSFIEVRYLYAYKGGSLAQPVYLGKRADQLLEDCKLSQLKYKNVLDTITAESSQDSRWAW